MATPPKIGFESLCWEYDVFLSFRGEDTRKTFTGHLRAALRHASIHTFIDEDELKRGEYLAPELTTAIQSSRIAMIVFSKDYASSRWCLEELVQIIECKEKRNQTVFPIFYDVDPSEVRNPREEYGVALAKHEERFGGSDKVQQWRDALTKVGNMSGWYLHGDFANGYESKLIDEIIKEVILVVRRQAVDVPKHVVGLQSRVEHVAQSMWGERDNSVRMIGIYGIGGVGKTTLAQVLYNNFFRRFERSCFLDLSSGNSEITNLQERLLSKLVNRNFEVGSQGEGIMFIKKWLQAKKCLIVLDNLDHMNQFEALCGERDWFGVGSRLILTTREAHVLKKLKKDEHFEVKALHHQESLQLFRLHAFRESVLRKEDYTDLLDGIVNYCGGLPLALKVLGAYLSDKTREEWISAFEKLKKIPNKDVQSKLMISYDGLPDENIKSLFLDLVCFSNGVSKETIHSMRDFSTIEIRDLIDRCLINCDRYGISMHSLIREMGREIIRLESPNNPGERSRLWCPNEIEEVLKEQKGTKKIEMIVLNSPMKNMKYNTKAFQNMENLRFLQINEVHLDGNFKYLSNKMLRCLNWNGCPLKYIPSSCSFEKLVSLNMRKSNIKEFRAPIKYFPCLKILDLDESRHLTRTPDFSGSQNLRELFFSSCSSLVEVHSSIGELGKLVSLNLYGCIKLKKLPNEMSHLCMLQSIELTGSNNLKVLPKLSHSVNYLNLFECYNLKVIQEFPSNLGKIYLDSCKKLKMLPELPHELETLSASNCVSMYKLPNLSSCKKLINLDLTGCKSLEKVSNLSSCKQLDSLDLTGCLNLKMLPELPHQLTFLYAINCESLEKVSNLSDCTKLMELDLSGCRKLKEIQDWDQLVWDLSESIITKEKMDLQFIKFHLICDEIPSWITCKEEGSSMYFQWPECNWEKYTLGFLGFMFWVVIKASELPPLCDKQYGTFRLHINGSESDLDQYENFVFRREDISVLILCLRSCLHDKFCRYIKAGEVMKLTVKREFCSTFIKSKKREENLMKEIGVAALYRDTHGLLQFVPITRVDEHI